MDLGRNIQQPNPNSLHWRKVITTDDERGDIQWRGVDKFPHVTSTINVENTEQHLESSLILEVYGIK